MNKPVRFGRLAQEELEAAESYYEESGPIGADFIAAVREGFRRLAAQPHIFPLARGIAPSSGVRRCPLRKFPYALFFVVRPHELRVIAISHDSRRPGYWRQRL